MFCNIISVSSFDVFLLFFFSSRRRHTRCALVTGVQTCALPIWAEKLRFAYAPLGRIMSAKVAFHVGPRYGGRLAGLERVPGRPCREIGRASCRERVCQYV